MRDDQFLAADDVIAKEKQVQVDHARLPTLSALAAKFSFNFQQTMKQRVGAERCADLHDAIEEWRGVVVHPDGGVFKHLGNAHNLEGRSFLELLNRRVDVVPAV